MSISIKVATAQFPVEFLDSFAQFADKIERWVATAAEEGATLLVFPEYASMELVSLFPEEVRQDLQFQMAQKCALLKLRLKVEDTTSIYFSVRNHPPSMVPHPLNPYNGWLVPKGKWYLTSTPHTLLLS
ncbi:MAG: hypothetical protein ACNA8W_18445 [Bradymonadaceae bacterium]